jgi:protein MpaA
MIPKTTFPIAASRHRKNSITDFLDTLSHLAKKSDRLFPAHLEFTDHRGATTTIPRFLFTGPGERSSFLRVGIFAGIHGDEVSGVHATVELLKHLHQNPDPVLGYELFVYPVCNPWGFAQNTRWLKSGADMNREFWRGTNEIEVLMLEGQLMRLAFDGIIALHTDDSSHGLYGFAKGHQLTRHVLEPALESASRFIPRNFDRSIDNFQANQGIIEQGYAGILGAPPTQSPRPFEIVFETPHHAPADLQTAAHIAAITSILANYRSLISHAQNI